MPLEKDITDFSDAVTYGQLEKVKTMLEQDAELINSKDNYGFTALHNVMAEEQFETIQFLIEKGVDVDAQNEVGISPLHLACYPEIAELLLTGGANIDITDNYGNTPLHVLAAEGSECTEVIEYLISKGANKVLENNSGKTALDIASSRKDWTNIKLLQ